MEPTNVSAHNAASSFLPAKRPGALRNIIASSIPLFIWAIIATSILSWDAARKSTLSFEIHSDKGSLSGLNIRLDGGTFISGSRVWPGYHILSCSAVDMEVFETNFVSSFGATRLEPITLKRSTGDLSITAEPIRPEKLHIEGIFFKRVDTDATTFEGIPVGNYEVTARFGDVLESTNIKVLRNQRTDVRFKPNIGWLTVQAEPTPATFRIEHLESKSRSSGSCPTSVMVRSGKHEILVWRGPRVLRSFATVERGKTNEASFKFEYASLDIKTTPAGALVQIDGDDKGTSPLHLDEIVPGRHIVEIAKPGYDSLRLAIDLKGDVKASMSTNLVAVRVPQSSFEAKESAKEKRAATSARDNDPPTSNFEEELRKKAQAATEDPGKAERDKVLSRMQFAEQTFKREIATEADEELFQAYQWQAEKPIRKVRSGFASLAESEKRDWDISPEQSIDDTSSVFRGSGRGPVGKKRHFTIVACEIAPGHVELHAKFWDYALGNNVTLNLGQGLTPDSIVPVHPDRVRGAEQRMKALADGFKEKLFRQLK